MLLPQQAALVCSLLAEPGASKHCQSGNEKYYSRCATAAATGFLRNNKVPP